MSQFEPPPLNYDDLEPPPGDWDYAPEPFDLFPLPDDELYTPDDRGLPDMPPVNQDGLQGFESAEPDDVQWSWHDARLIGVDRGEEAGERRYEVGAVDLYANLNTGDLGGSYLSMAAFAGEASATAYYHNVQEQIHERGLAPHEMSAFAEDQAPHARWRGAEPAEYEAYEHVRGLDAFDPALADDPPESALDPLLQTAMALGGVVEPQPKIDESAFQALSAIGVQAESTDPPPFFDESTNTAYWIGVFQPDANDRENCVTSILSLGRNPETDELEAQLAPVVVGEWDKAYKAAEHLIQIAEKGDIERLFDAAEGMALATDQRELWESERGLPLEPDATHELADIAREQWEVEL